MSGIANFNKPEKIEVDIAGQRIIGWVLSYEWERTTEDVTELGDPYPKIRPAGPTRMNLYLEVEQVVALKVQDPPDWEPLSVREARRCIQEWEASKIDGDHPRQDQEHDGGRQGDHPPPQPTPATRIRRLRD